MCIHNLWELCIGSFHYESEKKENKVLFLLKFPFYCNYKHFGEHQTYILSMEVT